MTKSKSTSAAYGAVIERARRKIDDEWDLTGREHTVMRMILRVSFECGLPTAEIPTQVILARACGLHKSDVCRALGRLIRMGALSRHQHCARTRYAIEMDCLDVPRKSPITEKERDCAIAMLLEIAERREGGVADSSGQMRLREIEPAEDVGLERAALAAELENQRHVAPAPAQTSAGGAQASAEDLDAAEVQRELAALRSRLDAGEAPRSRARQIGAVEACKRGLTFEQGILWDDLVKEILRSNKPEAWEKFVQYAGLWRTRLLDNTYALREAVSDHKLNTAGPADQPGAWIFKRYVAHGGKASFQASG